MDHQLLSQAVRNNAVWCDAVCRSHGAPGEFLGCAWICRHKAPPFYPNAITLTKGAQAEQLSRIEELIRDGLSGDWGVKDSYAELNLTGYEFRILFNAQWISHPAAGLRQARKHNGARWVRITNETDLRHWESAWRGTPSEEKRNQHQQLFKPQLLKDRNVTIIAAYRDRKIVAGAIGNLTDEVVGVSNLFLPDEEREYYRAACIAELMEIFPGRRPVGYESGADLEEMQAIGFRSIGALRVWTRV